MLDDISNILVSAMGDMQATNSVIELDKVRNFYIGKKSAIAKMFAKIALMSGVERNTLAAKLNSLKSAVERAYRLRREEILSTSLTQRLMQEEIDITLPGRGARSTGSHPLIRSLRRIERLFSSIGFEVADGPELETAFFNFTSLNMPPNHPARSMHDTFYIDGVEEVQLRTHTSPIQTRFMQQHSQRHAHRDAMPEIRIIAPGKAYRVDSDATHSPMFHQLEGLWVGEAISFANLKWVIQEFLSAFFDSRQLQMRFRASFFPFTEPSAEIDVVFPVDSPSTRWLEVGGCGMVHREVLKICGIDPERYVGFAFGMGVDRLTMLRYGIDDLRLIYENDLRFLNQFK